MNLERENDSTVLGANQTRIFAYFSVAQENKALSVFKLQKGNNTSMIIAELVNKWLDLFKSETTKKDEKDYFGGIYGTKKWSFSYLLYFIIQESRETRAE